MTPIPSIQPLALSWESAAPAPAIPALPALPPCPFKVGDRVRIKPGLLPRAIHRTGVVKRVEWHDELRLPGFSDPVVEARWCVTVKRPKARCRVDDFRFSAGDHIWELVPETDISLDETAVALARAVLAGDTTAALALADRVCGIVNRPS